MNVSDVRELFKKKLTNEEFVIDKTGVKTIEIVGASFVADEETIFAPVNSAYVAREIEWYLSKSLNVNDIPGGPPTIWKQVADKDGFINSNYGWCVFSEENGYQLQHVCGELLKSPNSRRAVAIYTRPSMWYDYNVDGRSDFMCTNAVQYMIRDGRVVAVVQMRSNDVWAGYRNDRAWQKFCLDHVVETLNKEGNNYEAGEIHWQVGSLHIYSRHFYLVDHYAQTCESFVKKENYSGKWL